MGSVYLDAWDFDPIDLSLQQHFFSPFKLTYCNLGLGYMQVGVVAMLLRLRFPSASLAPLLLHSLPYPSLSSSLHPPHPPLCLHLPLSYPLSFHPFPSFSLTGPYFVVQSGFKLLILLSQPPQCWNCRHVPHSTSLSFKQRSKLQLSVYETAIVLCFVGILQTSQRGDLEENGPQRG